jgi:hypothetical protein
MQTEVFAGLPENAQLWVYGFDRPLTHPELDCVRDHLERFMPTWKSHGTQVEGKFKILEDRFVLISGHLPDGISGCSIDESVRQLKYLKNAHGLDGLNRSLIFYRDAAGTIQSAPFLELPKLVQADVLKPESIVFDTTVTTLGQFRSGSFEKQLKDSWHGSQIAQT